jgi:hypothetical protein
VRAETRESGRKRAPKQFRGAQRDESGPRVSESQGGSPAGAVLNDNSVTGGRGRCTIICTIKEGSGRAFALTSKRCIYVFIYLPARAGRTQRLNNLRLWLVALRASGNEHHQERDLSLSTDLIIHRSRAKLLGKA